MDRHAENVRPAPGEGASLESDGGAENAEVTVSHPEGDSNPFLSAALSYAARGWRVFPLAERGKVPLPGSHGFLDATTDLDQIAAWWAAEPGANIGIATGPSGLLVLDVDGDQGRAALNGRHLPPTPTAMTGKGVHYYYQGDGPCKVGVLPGLDIRSDGGYVVAPPSVHPSGAVYCWADGLSPADLPLAPAPDWLTELLTADGPRNPSPVLPETIHAGRRNATLASLAGSMRRRGATAEAILAALLVENADRCRPPLPEAELRQIAESVGRYAPAPDPAAEVEALIAQVEAQDTPDPAPVWAAVPLLARVPKGEAVEVRRRLKKALGDALNLRDLGAAIAEARQGDAPDGAIVLGRQLRDVTGDALALLTAANDPPVLFRRSGEVVRVTRDEDHRPVMGAVGVDELRRRLSDLAPFVRMTDDGPRPADPPEVLARNILAAWELPFPGLQAVVESPALRPDGSVLDAPGYDPATLLFYAPAPGLQVPPVPATPTPDQVRAARTLLLDDLLGDFPFADDASRAGALALLLTPILRPALAGHVPLCIIDAPQAGTGKSLLASVVSAVATGRPAAMFSALRHDEEWAKRLLAVLVAGGTFVLIDNVSGALNSAALCRTLTAHTIADRELGATRILTAPQRATWCVTGNNVAVRGDLPRRCYWVRLEAHCESPWQREGFRHSDLQGWATEERGALLGALLTLCRAWWAAGKPTPKQTPLGSFEEWQRAVGGILALAEVPGFLDNLPALHAELDEESAEWAAFLGGWADVFGEAAVTAREVAEAALGGAPSLAEVLPGDVRDPKTGLVTAAGLGYALRRRRGIYHAGGWRLERTPKGKAGVLWRVVR